MKESIVRVVNGGSFQQGVDLWFKQGRGILVANYRDLIWEAFLQILRSTPQWSGKAVANWNISIGSPNFNWDDTAGDEAMAHMGKALAHERGDEKWMRVARDRARRVVGPKGVNIKYGDKVFISNGVEGDDDGGVGSVNYLQDLQDPFYWHHKLREVNKPYETAQETILIVSTRFGSKGYARTGGNSLDLA